MAPDFLIYLKYMTRELHETSFSLLSSSRPFHFLARMPCSRPARIRSRRDDRPRAGPSSHFTIAPLVCAITLSIIVHTINAHVNRTVTMEDTQCRDNRATCIRESKPPPKSRLHARNYVTRRVVRG